MRPIQPFVRPLALALGLLAGSAMAPAFADAVPDLDVEKTCRSAQIAGSGVSDKASYDGCLRSENEAKREAQKNWGSYSEPAKRQCEAQFKAGGYPSYVEMVTCLELASGSVPTQSGSGMGASGNAKPPRESGTRLTREPAASQRTNPIEVLENK